MRRRRVPVKTAPCAPRRGGEEHRPEVGTCGEIELRAGGLQPAEHIAADAVALQALRAQAGDGDALAEGEEKRGV